ncbi:hypothetical protein KAN5_15770 [Pseudoalteromonas sp. KAN5]|nr:hypothetical protein KAN5_15770 [Pseudoalteromonas sp. KAN5]
MIKWICFLTSFTCLANTELSVRYSADGHPYPRALLALALSKSAVTLVPTEVQNIPSQSRAIRLLGDKNGIDVFWGVTSPDWEKQAKAVLIPIDKGLLGYRIPLVHVSHKDMFAQVNHSRQLRSFVFGLREDWPDTAIFKRNELPTLIYGMGAEPIEMLRTGRIDALPYDIFDLPKNHGDDIIHEPHIAIRYPSAVYFFVANDNQTLHKLLQEGLLAAIADGSFDALFYEYFAATIAQADLKNRRIIELTNPLLPRSAPIHQAQFWLDKNSLTK